MRTPKTVLTLLASLLAFATGAADAQTPAKKTAAPAPTPTKAVTPGTSALPGPTKPARQIRSNVPRELKNEVATHPLMRRMATVAPGRQFRGGHKGVELWKDAALGPNVSGIPVAMQTPDGILNVVSSDDGKRLWLTAAMVRDESAILRLGDLMPLLRAVGINDRKVALSVTRLNLSGADAPPSYTLQVRTGALWPHRKTLAREAEAGRIFYSLSTGTVTVVGALVLADATGDLYVRRTQRTGDHAAQLERHVVPAGCATVEEAMRSGNPAAAKSAVLARLSTPDSGQRCAARYLATIRPTGADAILRKHLVTDRIVDPGAAIEALVALSAEPTKKNIEAVATMIRKRGTPGAVGVCDAAPLAWADALLDRDDLTKSSRSTLSRCGWH